MNIREQITKKEREQKVNMHIDPWEQRYHIMPPVGILHAPNGLCDCDGDYYVYFQYSPLDKNDKGQCWGLYKSRDLVHFTYIGVPIIADKVFDQDGVFSGSALLEGKEMYLFYTGKTCSAKKDSNISESNTIVIKVSKDSYFNDVYSDKYVVMTDNNYKQEASGYVSGPMVWKEVKDYYMVLAAQQEGSEGVVLLFTSVDKIHWEFIRTLKPKDSFCGIWECPDFFKLDNKKIMSISMISNKNEGSKEHNLYYSGYYLIEGDIRSNPTLNKFMEYDRGFDFYAPQTFLDRKERRVMIAFMGSPGEVYENPTIEYGWQHCLTAPRVLQVKEGKLIQSPIEELKGLRTDMQTTLVREKLSISLENTSEIIINLNSKTIENECNIIINNGLILTYNVKNQLFSMEYTNGEGKQLGAGRTKRMIDLKELYEVQILFDTSSVEVFLNCGEEVLTSRIYKKEKNYKLEIMCPFAKATWWRLNI